MSRSRFMAIALGLMLHTLTLAGQQCDAGVIFSGAIVITHGGTYTGNWQSTDPNVPAVRIYTTQPVTILNSRLKGPGDLLLSDDRGNQLAIKQSCFIGTNPNRLGVGKGSPIHTYQAASVLVENSDFESGGFYGIWVQDYAGNHTLDNTITIVRNRIHNIDGRLSDGNGGWLETYASQEAANFAHGIILSNVLGVPGIEIGWNQIVNEPYVSGAGDSINIYNGSGTATSPAEIHDNYIEGGYDSVPTNQNNLPYYGSAFTTDGSYTTDPSLTTAFLKIHDMQAVNFSNAGIGVAVGHDVEMFSNRVVSSGELPDGTNISTSFSAGVGYSNYLNNPAGVFGNNSVYDNLSGLRRQRNGVWERFDYYFSLPPTIAYNNADLSPTDPSHPTLADEANELSLWNQKLITNGVTIGSPLVRPIVSVLSPGSVIRGAPAFLLTVNGTGFLSGAQVLWNGAPLSTTFVNNDTLTASVPANLVVSPGVATIAIANPGNGASNSADFPIFQAEDFLPVPPCRLVDTRQTQNPIRGGTTRNFNPSQLGGCNIPASAAAYSFNLTVVPQGSLGYLTVWPMGEIQPIVSVLNSLDGRVKANATIVPAGRQSSINIYASDTTDVVLDIDGYFTTPGASTLKFYSLPPCRVADTRKSNFPPGLGTPHLSHGVARDFPLLNATTCNIPATAQAYSLNMTAIPFPSLGHPLAYLEVWPTGQQPQHPVSTLNNPTATYVANAAIVPAGTDGKITAFASDDTDLAIDINGYFAAPGEGGLSLYPMAPCRVIDTRHVGNGQPFTGTLSPPVDVVDSPCGVPDTAQAYVFNATVVPSGNLSYLTLWPDSQGQPVVSTLNAADGFITSNMAIVPSVNGRIDAYAAGITQLILDISSYFAP